LSPFGTKNSLPTAFEQSGKRVISCSARGRSRTKYSGCVGGSTGAQRVSRPKNLTGVSPLFQNVAVVSKKDPDCPGTAGMKIGKSTGSNAAYTSPSYVNASSRTTKSGSVPSR
jgi:hypothetical protein